MATVASTPRTNTITLASATAGPFEVGFRLFDTDTLEVYLNGQRTSAWTLSAAFTDGYSDGATITFNAELEAGDVVQIDGALQPRREADYLTGDPGLTRKLNVEMARLWAGLSEVKRKSETSLRTFGPAIPFTPVPGASVGFDDEGNPTSGPLFGEIAGAAAAAQTAVEARDEVVEVAGSIVSADLIERSVVGDGVVASLTFPGTYSLKTNFIDVTIGGVQQSQDAFTLVPSGTNTVLTFPTPIPIGLTARAKATSQLVSEVAEEDQITDLSTKSVADRAAALAWIAAHGAPPVGFRLAWGGVAVRYVGSGTVIADMPGYVPDGDYDPAHFGADYTGATDSQAAFQACVTAAAGVHKIKTGPGTLRIDSRVIITASNQQIDLGMTEIDATQFTGWTSASIGWDTGRDRAVIEVRGQLIADDLVLTADAVAGVNTITVDDASSILPGDIVTLQSSGQLWYTYETSAFTRRDVNRVRSVSGSVVTLDNGNSLDFDTSGNTVTVTVVRPVENVTVSGGIWDGGGVRGVLLNGFGPCAFTPEGTVRCTFAPVLVYGFQNKVCAPSFSMHFMADGGIYQGLPDDYATAIVENENSGFYGVYENWCRFSQVSNIVGRRCRHVVDGFISLDMRVSHVAAEYSHKAPFACHSGADRWSIEGCTISDGVDAGINWRGLNLSVSNTRILGLTGSAFVGLLDLSGSGASDVPVSLIIRGCDFRANSSCISVGRHNLTLEVYESHIETAGASSAIAYNGAALDMIKVRGGTVKSTHTRAIQVLGTSLSNVGATVDVQDATIEAYTERPLSIFHSATGTNVIFKNNKLIPNVSAVGNSLVSYSGRASGALEAGPNYYNDTQLWEGRIGRKFGNYVDADANTLDWFEEGTFLPQLLVGGVSTGITQSVTNGYYRRIGEWAEGVFQLNLSNKGAGTTSVTINLNDFPFTNTNFAAAPIYGYWNNMDSGMADRPLVGRIAGNTKIVTLWKMSSGTSTNLLGTDLTNTSSFSIGFKFRV